MNSRDDSTIAKLLTKVIFNISSKAETISIQFLLFCHNFIIFISNSKYDQRQDPPIIMTISQNILVIEEILLAILAISKVKELEIMSNISETESKTDFRILCHRI